MSGFSLTTAQYLVETLATVAFALSGVIEAARRGGIGAFRGQRNPDWIIGGGARLGGRADGHGHSGVRWGAA